VESSTGANHHQDQALFGPPREAVMGPGQGFAVDVLFQDPFAQHQTQVLAGPPPRHIGRLVDDVTQIIEASRCNWLTRLAPETARLAAFPLAGGEAQDFHLHPAALKRARQNVGGHGGDGDRPSPHGAGVVDQQRHHGVTETHFLFALERQGMHGIGDDAGEAARIQQAFLKVKLPGALLLRHQFAL